MRKPEKLQIIRNVGSSWFALGISVGVGLFLSPFILHRLGDEAFGIWVLIFSLTGYYGLFDLGIRSSIVRYISKDVTTNDFEHAAKVVNTSLFSYSLIGTATFLITIAITFYLPDIFRSIPAQFVSTARWLLLMVGTSVALGFPLGVSGGVLEGLQKFYVLNWTNIVATVLRAVFIVIALRRGYGLLMVAFITVALPFLMSLIRAVIAAQLLRVPLGLEYVNRTVFQEVARYGGPTFLIIIAARLRFKSDSIVIGSFLSATAITYFNIGSRIVDYATEVVESLAQIFNPMSSHSEAQGNLNRLRKIFVTGNRFCAFTIFPICAALVILGKSVIEVWVGIRYVKQSYPVLLIILFPTTMLLAQAASPRVLFGMSKHKLWAVISLIEGIVNVVLSIILVRPYGIVGDALGTAIPLAATTIFFLPRHLCQNLQIALRTYLREAYLLPAIVCIPTIVVLLLMKSWFVPHNYPQLAAHLAVSGLVYGLSMMWAFALEGR